MDSIKYSGYGRSCPLPVVLKDRPSELKRIGLERLLSALYKRQVDLPIYIEELGVDSALVESLRLNRMPFVVDQIIHQVHTRVARTDTSNRRYPILERFFGLDGNLPARLSAMAAKYDISRERVRQIKERSISGLRMPHNLNSLESFIRSLAYHSRGVNESIPVSDVPSFSMDTSSNLQQVRLSSHREMAMLGQVEPYLTDEQAKVFSEIGKANRILVRGCSGSGKTLLALLTAQKLAASGKKVLLTCYSRALANHLESLLVRVKGIYVASFHALCLRSGTRAGVKIPGGWNHFVWDSKFPEVLESALIKMPELKFDAIIVDDSQDFKMNWYQALLSALKSRSEGFIHRFEDDNESLASETRDADFDQSFRKFSLNKNLRTPPGLSAFLRAGYELDFQNQSKSQSKISYGSNCRSMAEFYFYNSADDARVTCAHILNELTASFGILPSEIAVLTPKLVKNSVAYGCSSRGSGRLVVRYSSTTNHPILSRIQTFKGLERRAVILVDIDGDFASLDQNEQRRLIYIAAGRTTDKLIFIGDKRGFRALQILAERPLSPSPFFSQRSPVYGGNHPQS